MLSPELGFFALILAFTLSALAAPLGFYAGLKREIGLLSFTIMQAILTFLLVAFAFACLVKAFVGSDFSVANVYANSHSLQPLIYKFTSVWGSHEGSMLLWIVILTLFAALVAAFAKNLPLDLKAYVLGSQALLTAAFTGFSLFTSNPFARLDPAPFEGKDLNPVLQDLGLAIHPPLLYLGYVGFSIVFSFAIAALLSGRIDAVWARYVRPWTLLAWGFLTLGIAMGSYWAYYELGWGGWWFWDPVENASLMPWLTGTALLHSALVMEKREALKIWTVLLAIISFSLSLLGTFLVRSGVLTSVHSFAVDPERGLVILVMLIFFIGGSLLLFAIRVSHLKEGGLFAPVSREGALVVNNIFLSISCLAVLIGTLYPLFLDVLGGEKISVGAPFFNLVMTPLFMPIFLLMPLAPFLAWKRAKILPALTKLKFVWLLTALTIILVAYLKSSLSLAPFAFGVGVYIALASLQDLLMKYKTIHKRPRAQLGTALAHFGVGICLMGVTSESAWNIEQIVALKPQQTVQVGEYQLRYLQPLSRQGENFRETIAQIELREGGVVKAVLTPSKRFYPARAMPTTESALYRVGFSHLYLSLGESEGESIVLRAYWKPLVLLIWLGALFMALGAVFSLSDQRLRFGVAK